MIDALRQGGWVMVPIILCSLGGLAIVIERLVALRRIRIFDAEVVELVARFSNEVAPDSAMTICRRSRGPLARIIEAIIAARHLNHAQVLETMQATGRSQVGRLERGLTVLEIIANVSPLLGLLGTVLGMVTVFNAITAEGVGDPQILADGISKALITTVAGLTVAIPALASHSWLSRCVDDLAVEMQDQATSFVSKLHAVQTQK